MVKLTFDLKVFLPFSLIVLGLIIANSFLLYVKQVTTPVHPTSFPLWAGLFSPKGHNLNIHVKWPLGKAKYQKPRLALSDKKFFVYLFFSYISVYKTCRPRGGAIFGPQAIIWTILAEVH